MTYAAILGHFSSDLEGSMNHDDHVCVAIDCGEPIALEEIFCPRHKAMLPRNVARRLCRNWIPPTQQQTIFDVTPEYLKACRSAVAAIALAEHKLDARNPYAALLEQCERGLEEFEERLAVLDVEDERTCRRCGCTEEHACPGGCYWVDWDLCNQCLRPEELLP